MNHNDRIFVQNIGGTGSAGSPYRIPGLSSKFVSAGGTASGTCQVYGCGTSIAGGHHHTAHVRYVDGRRGGDWQLVRVCPKHNNRHNTEPMALKKGASVVSVNQVRGRK